MILMILLAVVDQTLLQLVDKIWYHTDFCFFLYHTITVFWRDAHILIERQVKRDDLHKSLGSNNCVQFTLSKKK